MASTTLPADRLKAASERSAVGWKATGNDSDHRIVLGILHLASAALSVNANSIMTVSSEEFLLLAENW